MHENTLALNIFGEMQALTFKRHFKPRLWLQLEHSQVLLDVDMCWELVLLIVYCLEFAGLKAIDNLPCDWSPISEIHTHKHTLACAMHIHSDLFFPCQCLFFQHYVQHLSCSPNRKGEKRNWMRRERQTVHSEYMIATASCYNLFSVCMCCEDCMFSITTKRLRK